MYATGSEGQNLLGLSYPGGNNPLTFNKNYTNEYVPKSLAEYPAIGHDRRYDNLRIKGAKGLLFETRAIGADWRFVVEEHAIAINPGINPIYRAQALILGQGLAFFVLPKTLYQLTKPNWLLESIIYYRISDYKVTNKPSNSKK